MPYYCDLAAEMLLDVAIDYGVWCVVGDDLVETCGFRLNAILWRCVLDGLQTFNTHVMKLFGWFGGSWVEGLRNFGAGVQGSGCALGLLVVAKQGDAPPWLARF